MTVKLNEKEFLEALGEAFTETNEILGRKFAQAIDDPKWVWPTVTQRHAGAPVGTPRNIVDRGELKTSYKPSQSANKERYSHAWTANHAMAVHEGAVIKGRKKTTARPWARQTIEETKTDEIFSKIARRKLERIQ